MDMLLEKYYGFNFPTWKVKIQMQLLNENPWGIVKGTKTLLIDSNKLLEWESRDDKAEKSSKVIWDIWSTSC